MNSPESLLAMVGAAGDGQAPLGERRMPSRARAVLARFFAHRTGLIGLVGLVGLFVLAFGASYLGRWDYSQKDFTAFLRPPDGRHWFGTTQVGADVFALTLRGLQKSLVTGLCVALFSTLLAAVVGSVAGYFGGWVDRVLTGLVDLALVLPAFFVLAVLSPTRRGGSWLTFALLLAAFLWMVTARMVRAMTIALRERPYVLAARYLGVSAPRIILRHILPHLSSLLIIDATINVSAAVLAESGLSFFGFGVQPPDVSLGTLIADGYRSALIYPWLFCFSAGLLVTLVLSVNMIGDGLRDALDPSAGRAR